MIRTDRRMRLCTALLVGILVFIWGNSLMPAQISQAFSDWVKELLFGPPSSQAEQELGSGILRKLAHFTEFTALGMCLGWHFGMLGKGKRLPFVCGTAVAAIDETIQCFVPDRGPSVRDVCIDSAGVLTGIALLYLGHTYYQKRSTKPILEDK